MSMSEQDKYTERPTASISPLQLEALEKARARRGMTRAAWLREAVEDFLLPDSGLFTCVLEAEGAIQGVFFGHIGSMWFSDDLCGFDDVWYVSPEYRGTIESVRMLRRFEWWCKDSGCKAALVGVSSGVMVDRTSAILERLGYGRLGGLFRRDF